MPERDADAYRTEPNRPDPMGKLIVWGVVAFLLLCAYGAWKAYGG